MFLLTMHTALLEAFFGSAGLHDTVGDGVRRAQGQGSGGGLAGGQSADVPARQTQRPSHQRESNRGAPAL